ncbi:MAG TPA: Uma2 family endonuclease, partial [Thermoanaerobaculia bacterium]|nr:Uma2 family endonuclease [Thermoanaerobaculia bacterium]
APFEVVLSNRDIVQPDLVFISNQRFGILTGKNAEGAPDLFIEVLSKGTRKIDETRKLQLYERAGASEYWMFDTARETARIYGRQGDRLVLVRELSAAAGDVLETPLLPGLRIPLNEVFS